MSQDKIQKARELVLNYIATHTLSDKLNRAVNEVCRSRPKDPWLFLSDIISEWTKDVPIIDRLVAKQGIDCYGNNSIQLQLFGRVSNARPPRYLGVENVFILNNKSVHSNANMNTNSTDEKKEQKENSTDENVQSMMKTVSEFLSPALRSIRIDEQTKIDEELNQLYSANDGLQKLSHGKFNKFNIIPTISNLIAITTSNYLRMPLYKYLSKTKLNANRRSDSNAKAINYTLPNIMCTLTKSYNNTLPNIIMVSTNNKRPRDRIIMFTEITNQFISIINRNVCFEANTGAILLQECECKNMQQLLDLIYKAIENCGGKYKIGLDLFLGLSFSDNPSLLKYNESNETYILNGESKQRDDIIEYLNGLRDKNKGLKYLEDPLHNTDEQTYALLNDKQIQNKAENICIIGNTLYGSVYKQIEKGIKMGWSSCVFVCMNSIFTVTKALNISNLIQKCNGNKSDENRMVLMFCDNQSNNATNIYSIDLAIACNANIIRLALPNCGKSTNKYNRWLMIADELSVDMDQDYNKNSKNMNPKNNMETIDEQNNNNDDIEQNVDENIGNDADKTTEDLP